MRRIDVPEFGTLNGLKVAFHGVSIAGPFFGALCADNGADVIWIEPASRDSLDRAGNPWMVAQDRRNMRNLAINIPTPEGKKLILDLVRDLDIFMESNKAGQYDAWGLTDEVLWEANPRLIIVHLSGFGQDGDPNYVHRASYDPIAQAFSGMMFVNQRPGEPMVPVNPNICDFMASLMAYGSAMGAYIKCLKTGVGESIDVSQFESTIRCMGGKAVYDLNLPAGHPLRHQLGMVSSVAGYNSYICKDGKSIMLLIFGVAVMEKAYPLLGLDYGSEELPKKPVYRLHEPEGIIAEKAVRKFCEEHTAQEIEELFAPLGIPAIVGLTFDDMPNHPHFIAREVFIECPNEKGEDVLVSNIFPKMKNNPGKVWRKPPARGEDSRDILLDLGYTEEEYLALKESGTIF